MLGDYLRKFQDFEDKVEGTAYLTWRRFEWLGTSLDVLCRDFNPDAMDADTAKGYRNFTVQEMALIQFGKLIALKEGGMEEPYSEKYRLLRGFFIGSEIVTDYEEAVRGQNDYDPAEILCVAMTYGNFNETDINTQFSVSQALLSKAKSLKAELAKMTPNLHGSVSDDVPSPRERQDFYNLYDPVEKTIGEIDDMLLSRM